MSISYKLFLNTTNLVNRVDATTNTYYINWEAFLPKEYKMFQVNYAFHRTLLNTTTVGATNFITISFNSQYSTDQLYAGTNKLNYYSPSAFITDNTGGIRRYYSVKIFDNVSTIISYPTNNYVTVKIEDFNGNKNPSLTDTLVVFLSFTPIIEKKKKKKIT